MEKNSSSEDGGGGGVAAGGDGSMALTPTWLWLKL